MHMLNQDNKLNEFLRSMQVPLIAGLSVIGAFFYYNFLCGIDDYRLL